MQCLFLDSLCTLLTKGAFMPPQSEGTPKLSGMTAILLVFQADSKHEEIIDVYMGLMVCQVESHLYAPDQILDFVKDIEANLQVVHDALNARGDPSKRRAFCLFVDNLSGAMSVPMDPSYCLVYPTNYIKGVEMDHFDTHNSPMGMRLHHCICHATLQFSNKSPHHSRWETSRHNKSHKKDLGEKKKKAKDTSPAQKSTRYKGHKDSGHC